MNRRPSWAGRVPSWMLLAVWPFLLLFVDRGQLNADTKYDLTGDPWRLITAAMSSWDETLHGGWVLQQHAGYLWPTGPFFAVTEFLPDWTQQRLWLIALLVVAGLGTRFAARQLGLATGAATVSGLVFQLSPYTVPYLARTSAMLLPWAVAGWVLGAAVLATRRPSPRWLAVIALAFATAGGVNSTAILMIAPLPIIWFWWAHRCGDVTTARALTLSVATGVSSMVVSAWWLASAWIGSRHGPDLLSFSETLRDVSTTATGPEVLRLSGYWLTYVTEASGIATTDVGRLLTGSAPVVAATMLLALAGLAGALAGRWRHRGFAAMVTVVSVLLAVGVHPYDDPSPMGRLLLDGLPDTALTALRSSTRALPMLGLVLAIGAARLVSRLRPQPLLVVPGVALLAIAAPWFSLGRLVDPALERPASPPATWDESLAAIAGANRVLAIPGSEFSTFDWGHTQDPPWTSEAPVITRELLPLGSPDRMDLLLAFDDAIQEGRLESGSVATVAGLLDADTVWVAADVDHARYRTIALDADVLDGAPGLEPVTIVDDVAGVYSVDVADLGPVGAEVALAGAGRGTLAAINAGLITPGSIVWRVGTAPDDVPMIVTDGDRDAVRQWRSSQGTLGAVGEISDRERDGTAALITSDPVRTTVRFGRDADQHTVTASTYGDPFELQPEYRAAMALDGDPNTAWRVWDPSSRPSISLEGYVDALAPVAVVESGAVTRLRVDSVSRAGAVTALLDADADGHFEPIDLPAETYSLTVTIDAVAPGTTNAGLAELLVTPLIESLVVPPVDAGDAVVLERWRLERDIPGRSDAEPVLRRIVPVKTDAVFELRVIGVGEAGTECRTGVIAIDGVDQPIDTSTGGSCDGTSVSLAAGEHLIESTADQVVLTPPTWSAAATWRTLVLPYAFANGWAVRLDGEALEPVSLAGGSMAVRAPVGVAADDLEIVWTPDRMYRIALGVSGAGAVIALFVILLDPGTAPRRRRRGRAGSTPVVDRLGRRIVRSLITGAVVGVTIDPFAGVAAAVAVLIIPRVEWLGLGIVTAGAGLVVVEVILDRPDHGIAWPSHFGVLHVPVAAAVLMVGVWLVSARPDDDR